MKKIVSILLVLISFITFDTVSAKELIIQDRLPLIKAENKGYNRMYKFKDKLIFLDKYNGNSLDIYNNNGTFVKNLKQYFYHGYPINIGEYLFVVDYDTIEKYNDKGELVKSVNLSQYGNYVDVGFDGENLSGVISSYAGSWRYRYNWITITPDLEVTVSDAYREYNFSVNSSYYYDGNMFVYSSDTLRMIDKDLNMYSLFLIENGDYATIESIIGDGEYIYFTYLKDCYDNKHHLVKMRLEDFEIIWEKEFTSSINYIYTYFSDIKKLDNGNLLLSMGSLYEIDTDGNIVNQCKRCSFVGTVETMNGKFTGLGRNNFELFDSEWPHEQEPELVTLGESVKLEVKESANGRVRVSRETPRAGEEVVITLRPQVNYELDKLTVLSNKKDVEVTKISDKKYSFIMPEEDTSIEVTYKKK